MTKTEYFTLRKYRVRGTNKRADVNVIRLHRHNTFQHELAKFKKCWELLKKDHKFITEAETYACLKCGIDYGFDGKLCEKCGKKLRKVVRDVVDLTTGEAIEIVFKNKKEYAENINVVMI